jgi:hypothetical protein
LLVALVAVAGGGVAAALAASSGTPISKVNARAFIRAVTLQAADVPGFAPFGGEAGSPPGVTEKQEGGLRCGHEGKPHGRAVDADGSLLADRSEEAVGSLVVVMPSEALAKAEIATLAARSGRRCLAHGLRDSGIVGGPGSRLYAIKITFVPVSSTLGQGAVDVHLLARLRRARFRPYRVGRHRDFPPPPKLVYLIGAIFRVGAADIVFFAISPRRQFPDATTERHLLGLLYDRATVYKL